MTEQQKIIAWLNKLPTKSKIEKEAGLQQGKLSDKRHKWRPETLAKIKKVVKKYGFKNENLKQSKR